jgi:plasmid stabilization system protein ParE
MMRRKTGGNAHVAVYSVDEQAVNLLHVFHSAQDWESRLAEENM